MNNGNGPQPPPQPQQLSPQQIAWQNPIMAYQQAVANAITDRNHALQGCRQLIEYCSQVLPQLGVQDANLYTTLSMLWQQIENIRPIHIDPNMPPVEMVVPGPAPEPQPQQQQHPQHERPRVDIRDAGMRGIDSGRVAQGAREASPREAMTERVKTSGMRDRGVPEVGIRTSDIQYTDVPDGIRINTR